MRLKSKYEVQWIETMYLNKENAIFRVLYQHPKQKDVKIL